MRILETKSLLWVIVLVFWAAAGCAPVKATTGKEAAQLAAASPLAGSTQLLLVVAEGWDVNQARLRRFERASAAGPWRPVGDDVAVTIGKNGLAWGRGLHGERLDDDGTVKVEGDGRAPAGVFPLPSAFAYDPGELWTGAKLPMHRVTAETICVETIDSRYYNRIVDEAGIAVRDYADPDRMLRPDGLYRYGLYVAHNAPTTKAGAGSCIFMHLWRRPGAPTAGCTAMAEPSLLVILAWIDAAKNPILVQLPRLELTRLAPAWGAPELAVRMKAEE